MDLINANMTLLNGKTLEFAIRDTCGDLSDIDCPLDLARFLVSDDDVTATVVGPFYGQDSGNQKTFTSKKLFEKLSHVNRDVAELEARGVFPLLDITELHDRDDELTDTVRYVSQSCVLQATAAVDFLVEAGWQDIVLITSADNCGVNVSKEFHKLVQERHQCNFRNVLYYEEIGSSVVVTQMDQFNPTDISKVAPYEVFQSIAGLDNPNMIVVVLSSIPFAYTLLNDGYYNIHLGPTPEQKKNFTFLLGDFWGDPGYADTLYKVVTNMARDSKQVVSLRAVINGYEKFQHHMANLTSSSRELRRNKYLGQYWSGYFNCTLDVNCSDCLRLPVANRPILRNTMPFWLLMLSTQLLSIFGSSLEYFQKLQMLCSVHLHSGR